MFLSPTYFIYSNLRMEDNDNKMEVKKYNRVLADNIKKFYFGIAISILFTINMHHTILNWKQSRIFYLSTNILFLYIILKWYDKFFRIKIKNSEIKEKFKYRRFSILCNFVMKNNSIVYFLIVAIPIVSIDILKLDVNKIMISYLLIYYFGVSRPFHFFSVFFNDAFKKLRSKSNKNGISKSKRARKVYIVLMSYLSLIIEYSILYYILEKRFDMFSGTFENIIDSLYFSVITITTIGYGDFYPTCSISRLFVTMQIISGMFLLGISLVTYMNEE